ncbi:mechanosensitive ion channel family protein [bacterium]|nr:mechanosensitive ion channel family protein [bacterium]
MIHDFAEYLENIVSEVPILSSNYLVTPVAYLLVFLALLLLTVIVDFLSKKVLLNLSERISRRTSTEVDDAFLKHRVAERLAHLVPGVVFLFSAEFLFPKGEEFTAVIERLALCYIVFYSALTTASFLDAATDISKRFRFTTDKPVKSYAQVIKLIIFLLMTILMVSILIDRSPWVLLSGLGAMTAVLLLIFKDSILGFVASIQISAYDMVRVGDWVEFPKYGADGDVVDISLNVITIQNWDKTLTSIPPYAFISESFKNWRGMTASGGRRIKRALSIDMNSVCFLTEELYTKLSEVTLLSEYLKQKQEELEQSNSSSSFDLENPANGRRLTNLGTFRAYIEAYLRANENIHQEMTLIVRQLAPSPEGIPIEIYAFSRIQAWAKYEGIISDIFDHLLAVIPVFGLQAFQNPSGNDIANALTSLDEHRS